MPARQAQGGAWFTTSEQLPMPSTSLLHSKRTEKTPELETCGICPPGQVVVMLMVLMGRLRLCQGLNVVPGLRRQRELRSLVLELGLCWKKHQR